MTERRVSERAKRARYQWSTMRSIRVTPEQHRRLKAMAVREGMGIAEVLDRILMYDGLLDGDSG